MNYHRIGEEWKWPTDSLVLIEEEQLEEFWEFYRREEAVRSKVPPSSNGENRMHERASSPTLSFASVCY